MGNRCGKSHFSFCYRKWRKVSFIPTLHHKPMKITLEKKTMGWKVFIIQSIESHIPIGTKEVYFFSLDLVASFLGYSFRIYFDKFVLQSNSKRTLFLPNGLHINLIGQIEHFNIPAL